MEQRRKRTIDEKSTHLKNRQKREQYLKEQRELEQQLYEWSGTGPYGELEYIEPYDE